MQTHRTRLKADRSDPLFPIGEAARRGGVTTRTIRYYEELGLISPRRSGTGSRRLFSEFHVRLIGDIQQLASLGFTLDEIKQIMSLKRVFFDEAGRVRPWRRRDVPLSESALRALQVRTESVRKNIRSQEVFLERVQAFLSRFLDETQEV